MSDSMWLSENFEQSLSVFAVYGDSVNKNESVLVENGLANEETITLDAYATDNDFNLQTVNLTEEINSFYFYKVSIFNLIYSYE